MKNLLLFLAVTAPALLAQSPTITTPNALPVATVNQAYSAQISATGGATPYSWHFVSGISPSPRFTISGSGLLSGTPTSADLGVLSFSIQVTDANGATVTKSFSVTVQSTQPLVLTTTAFPSGVVGAPYSLQLLSSGGTPPYKWAVLPAIVTFPVPGQVSPGLMLDPVTGLVTGTPTSSGSFSFTVTLTDAASGSVSKPYTLTVTPGGPLGILSSSLPNGTLGAPYSQTLQASGGIPPYKWTIATGALPNGLTLDANTGIISGAPLATGTASFTVSATDNAATPNTARQALSIAVSAPPPLLITTSSLPGGTQGAPYSQNITATGGVPPYHWSVTAGSLPSGLSLAADTGVIGGSPNAAGTNAFTVQVTDSAAGTAARTSQAYSITVAQLTQISVTAGALTAGTVNVPYSQVLSATGGAKPYSWTLIAGSLPPGLLLNNSGTLSGVPTVAAGFGFMAQVTDATGGTAIGAFSLTLNAAPLTMLPLTLPSGVAATPYPSQVVNAAGGAPPYTFLVVGTLPTGLSLTNGLISGSPSSTGTSAVTIMVTDSAHATATASQQLVVRSSLPPDLVLSTGSLAFSLSAGTSDIPDPQNFTVASSAIATPLSYQVSVSPAAPWLSITGGVGATATTPGGISVSLTSQALSLTSAASPYTTTISVTCVAPSTCSGNVQKIGVSLTVTSPPAQLSLTRSTVALSVSAPGVTASGIFGVQNVGGGAIAVSSVTAADSWLSVTGVPASIAPGPATLATITANSSTLAPGLYRSSITIATSAGTVNLPVTLLKTAGLTMALNPAGQLFQMSAGGATGNPNGSFEVLAAAGSATVGWNAAVLPGAPWLILKTPAGTSTPASPGSVGFSIDPAASAALAAGTYYGTIRVTSGQVTNSPQDFLVVLNASAAGTAADPDPEPSGLLFIYTGSATIPPQSLTLYAASTAPVPYAAAAITASGASWLSVSPTAGSASAASPAHPTVSVNPAGLVAGIYRGVVTYQFSPASLRSVNVTYIVPTLAGGLPFARQPVESAESPRAGGTCTASKLVATATGLPSNFAPQASWPTPLSILLSDDCGSAVSNGTVDATFSNGDPALGLTPDPANPGRYAGTWTPHGPVSQVAITASATVAGLASTRLQITGKVTPNVAPALTPGGMLNVFNPLVGGGVAPGTAVQIYGSNLAAPGTSTLASSLPFQTTLSGVSVLIGGVPAPLYYVSPGQINAQAPFELQPGVPYQVLVSTGGAITTPDRFVSAPAAPGIAAFANGALIAQHLDATLVTDASPAKPGEIIVFYLAGLGSAANQPATGNPAPLPPTDPRNPVTVTLNGTAQPALFVGLTPGTVGLYQIDFTVPSDTPDGSQLLTVTQAGATANVTVLPVHR